jgi:signal transduction histidine kinase
MLIRDEEKVTMGLSRLEQMDSSIKEMTDNIAHDLKSPITRIRGQAELALLGSGSGSREEYEAMAGTLHEIDLSKVVEADDHTDLQGEAACAGGASCCTSTTRSGLSHFCFSDCAVRTRKGN